MYASVFLNADVSADSMKTTEIFDRFLTLQKAGDPNAVRTLDPLRLRYFSPPELLRIFCSGPPSSQGELDFHWPQTITTKTKYKLIGNSINVEVVARLIEYLLQE